VLIVAVDINFY